MIFYALFKRVIFLIGGGVPLIGGQPDTLKWIDCPNQQIWLKSCIFACLQPGQVIVLKYAFFGHFLKLLVKHFRLVGQEGSTNGQDGAQHRIKRENWCKYSITHLCGATPFPFARPFLAYLRGHFKWARRSLPNGQGGICKWVRRGPANGQGGARHGRILNICVKLCS